MTSLDQTATSTCCDASSKARSLEEELAAMTNRYARALADADNMRKRAERDQANATKFALEGFFSDLLPYLDSLTHAVPDREGFELLKRKLETIISKHGLSRINAQGEPFNPEWHEAIKVVECEDAPDDTVCEEYRSGYLLHSRLLRPAVVAVNKHSETVREPETTQEAPTPQD